MKQRLSYLILGQKGGPNRIEIIEHLVERPYNINQLAELLGVNYRTAKHHVEQLLNNEIINSSKTGGYGEVYYLAQEMENNMDLFRDLRRKLTGIITSPDFIKNMIEQTDDAVIIIDESKDIIFWNESASRMFDCPEEDALGGSIEIFDESAFIDNAISNLKAGANVTGVETRGKKGSGKSFPLSVTVGKIIDDDEIKGYSILARDISQRKEMEHELRISRERYELAQKVAEIGCWDWDIEAGDLHWSDTIEPIFGFEKGKFEGTYEAFLECVHPDDRKFVVDSVNACVEAGEDYDIEHRIVWPDGNVRWVMETGNVMRDETGKAVRMLGIVMDITEKKRSRERIKKLNSILQSMLNISNIILKIDDEDKLLYDICEEVAANVYKLVWIGKCEPEIKEVVPIAQAGFEEGYLASVKVTYDDSALGSGPTGTAIKTGEASVMSHITTDPRYEPWRKAALERGYRSSAAVPIFRGEEVVGAVNVYSQRENAFEREEIKVLEKLSNYISLAMNIIGWGKFE